MQLLNKIRKNSQPARNVRFIGDDVMLTQGLKAEQRAAQEEFYCRYANHVRGVLVRVL